MKRIAAAILALSLFVCMLTGCKGKDNNDETQHVTQASAGVEVPVAVVDENGAMTVLKNKDGSDISILGENGEKITLTQDNFVSTVSNAAGEVSGIKTADGYIIFASQEGDKLVVLKNPKGECEVQLVEEYEEEQTTELLTTTRPTTTKPTTTRPKPKPTSTKKVTTTSIYDRLGIDEEEASRALEEAGIDKDNFDYYSQKILSYMVSKDGYFYTDGDPWQRNFGFNAIYDLMAPFAFMWYDTLRVKFNYDELDWMIQIWKGQYGFAFIGAEIGVYTKDPTREENHYDCAANENMLGMTMTLFHYNEKLFTRPHGTYWWMTGFVPGVLDSRTSPRSELTLVAAIDFKTKEMTDLFVNGLVNAGFKEIGFIQKSKSETYRVKGKTVELCWRYLDQKLKS